MFRSSSLTLSLLLPALTACQWSWGPGTFGVIGSDSPFISGPGVSFYLRPSDGLFCAVTDQGSYPLSESWTATTGYINRYGARPGPCSPADICQLVFQSDGNLVEYYNGGAVWQSGTSGIGASFNLYPNQVFAYILDAGGSMVWQSNAPHGPPNGCYGPADQCPPP